MGARRAYTVAWRPFPALGVDLRRGAGRHLPGGRPLVQRRELGEGEGRDGERHVARRHVAFPFLAPRCNRMVARVMAIVTGRGPGL